MVTTDTTAAVLLTDGNVYALSILVGKRGELATALGAGGLREVLASLGAHRGDLRSHVRPAGGLSLADHRPRGNLFQLHLRRENKAP